MDATPLEHLRRLRKLLRPGGREPHIDWLAAFGQMVDGWEAILGVNPIEVRLLQTLLAEAFLPAPDSPSQCVLLAAVQYSRDTTKLDALLKHCRELHDRTRQYLRTKFPDSGIADDFWLRGIGLRLDCIEFIRGFPDASPDDIDRKLANLLATTRNQFATEDWKDLKYRPTTEPAALRQLRRLEKFPLADHFAAVVQPQTAKQPVPGTDAQDSPLGWFDPAAVHLCNTLLALIAPDHDVLPNKERRKDGTGETWILIAVDHLKRISPDPTGLVLKFSIEVIPDGCGVLYPHPSNAAHIATLGSFQMSLRNAWSVVCGDKFPGLDARKCDFRWSLSVFDDSTELGDPSEWHRYRRRLMLSPLFGRSGELAIASALRSAVNNTPLDLSRAVTAQFADDLPVSGNPAIGPVLGVAQKALGISLIQQRTLQLRIDHLVLAADQTLTVDRLPEKLTRVTLKNEDFNAVFEELSRDAIITRSLKQRLRTQAVEFFQKECFGDLAAEDPTGGYILNPITRMPDDRDPAEAHQPDPETGQPNPLALEKQERDNLLLGILRPEPAPAISRVRPLRLVADSGMGKTTLLWRCLFEIASTPGPRIAILLQSLSVWFKSGTEEEFLKRIAGSLRQYLPDEDTQTGRKWNSKSRLEWLTRKVRRGEVVFLLDALDQTSDHVRNLNCLVSEITECPFLLTLRPDARESEAFQQGKSHAVAWDEVDVQPFTEAEAREYLNPYGDLFFTRLSDETNKEAGSVLTIPLILHLLRNFAIESGIDPAADPATIDLPQLRNRYSIYEHVICGSNGLIDKGVKSLKDAAENLQRLFPRSRVAFRKVSQIALWQLEKHHHFDNVITGSLYDELVELCEKVFRGKGDEQDHRAALTQLDLLTALNQVTAKSMVETDDTLVWRHRSFFEFLAGCRLAELIGSDDEEDRRLAVDTLFDIHNCLAADGSIRTKFGSQSNNGQRESFRDLPADWQWTLRFALAHAQGMARDQLAMELMAVGNPWVVYEAIDRDQVKLSQNVDALARWLVHQNWATASDYRGAMKDQKPERVQKQARLAVEQSELTRLAQPGSSTPEQPSLHWMREVYDPATRDAGCLFAAAELLPHAPDLTLPGTTRIKGSPGFEQLASNRVRAELAEHLADHRFVRLLSPHDELEMADFPVTNAWFELFCPSHRRWRDQYSSQDDQPVIYVSWYMADVFCRWLSALDDRYEYRLPAEEEWEAACKWGTTTDYWWGEEINGQLCWYSGSKTESRTRSRREAVDGFAGAGVWHPSRRDQSNEHAVGLLDLSGNVWEWGSDPVGPSRVLRGGSWYGRADSCRSSYRDGNDPGRRYLNVGFRVVRVVCSSCESPQSSSFGL
ncbi:MAG: sulfatase activating formylglycine-generating enzyme [Planctomycetaceae bacterium]|jgi:formylglycine-generating enzyme required for sulfatase activity